MYAEHGETHVGRDKKPTRVKKLQMNMKGKVSAEEMLQLTEAGINGWKYLAEGVGKTVPEVQKMTEKGLIPVEEAIGYIIEGMSEFDGMMDKTASRTVSGLGSQIKDTFTTGVIERWGKGLQEGAIDGLSRFLGFLEKIDPKMQKIGDSLYEMGGNLSRNFFNTLGNIGAKAYEVFDSDEFKNADTVIGKIYIAWDKIIAEPFGQWWDSGGREKTIGKAENLGKELGQGITLGLLRLLGFDTAGAAADGASIGKAFADGFIDGFDTGAIATALKDALGKAAKDALKVMPGGEDPTGSSWASAAILSVLGWKLGGKKVAGGIGSLFGKMKGGAGAAAGAGGAARAAAGAADDYADWWAGQRLWNMRSRDSVVGQMNRPNNPGIFGQAWQGIKGKAGDIGVGALSKIGLSVGKLNDIFGSGGKISEFMTSTKLGNAIGKGGSFLKGNALSLLFAGAAVASAEDKPREAAAQTGGIAGSVAGGWGGAKIGGAIGTAIAPGIGTAVGSAIGGFLGSILGYTGLEKLFGNLWDKIDFSAIGGKFDEIKESASVLFTETIPEKWNEFIEPAKGFFTETIPKKWNEFVEGGKTLFTETIPEKWNEFVEGGKTFFTETIPGKWDEAMQAADTFFFETLPEKAGEAFGKANVFFTETLPEKWEEVKAGAVSFFTETLPEKWEEAKQMANVFFMETLPEKWEEVKQTASDFFFETLPAKWEEVKQTANSFFFETLPAKWEETKQIANDFFLVTLPEKWEEAKQKAVGFFTETLPQKFDTWLTETKAAFTTKVDEWKEGWEDTKTYWKTKADEWKTGWESVKTYFMTKADQMGTWIDEKKGQIKDKWEEFKGNFTKGYEEGKKEAATPHAEGGIFSNPHYGLVAEAGPEAIIPLSSARRNRGLALWRKAGLELGVNPDNTLEHANIVAGGVGNAVEGVTNLKELAGSSDALYRAYLRDGIEKVVPRALNARTNAHNAAKGLTNAIYGLDKATSKFGSKLPVIGSAIQLGGVVLETAAEKGDKKRTFLSGLGGFAGQVGGGALAGAALGGMSLNPFVAIGGGVVGAVVGGIGGEKATEALYDRFLGGPKGGAKYAKHAEGGIFSNPHFGMVAEDGAEAIIPLSGKRRNRGLALWNAAGEALGANSTEPTISTSGNGISIQIGNVTIEINLSGGNGTIAEQIEAQKDDISNTVISILKQALADSFSNMPFAIGGA